MASAPSEAMRSICASVIRTGLPICSYTAFCLTNRLVISSYDLVYASSAEAPVDSKISTIPAAPTPSVAAIGATDAEVILAILATPRAPFATRPPANHGATS